MGREPLHLLYVALLPLRWASLLLRPSSIATRSDNDAYAEMAASKHPHIYGKPCGEAYPEIWQYMEPNAKAVLSGVAIYRLEDEFFFQTGPGGALEARSSFIER